MAEAPFVRVPNPATLFATRAARLRELADGHIMADYLRFLATVVQVQADLVVDEPSPQPVPREQLALRATHSMPPISDDQVRGDPDLLNTMRALLGRVDAVFHDAATPESRRRPSRRWPPCSR